MSDPVTNVEIEDVLSSIRRLVSNESRPSIHRPNDDKRQDSREKLMLTPALRIAKDLPAEAEDQGDRDQADESLDATDTDEDQNASAAEAALDAIDPDVSEAQTDAKDTAGAEDDVEMAAPQEESDSDVEGQHADDSAEARQEDRISELARAFGLQSVSRNENDAADSAKTTADVDTLDQQASGDDSEENTEGAAPLGAAAGLHLLRGADDEDESDEADFQDTADMNDTDDAPTAAAPADEAEVEAVEQQVEVIEVAEIAEAAPDEAPSLSEAAADLDATEASNETAEAGSVEVASDEAGADEAVLDEDALRELVGDIVRQELQGVLGERITRNIRKLVRREIHRFLAEQDID